MKQPVQKAHRPSPRIYHSLVYHTKADRIFLFGGHSEHGWIADLRDIWAYDLVNDSWQEVGVYEASPIKGEAQAPAYDSESNRIIVLNTEGETWAYHYEMRRWQKMNPSQTPKSRAGHRMAYDRESDRLILFGGFEAKDVNSPVYDETWAYDYNSDTWTRHSSPSAPQPELTYPAMVYRPVSDQMVIFGGAEIITPFDCEVTRQTWTYDFNTNAWTRLAPATTPPCMGIHAMAYHDRADKIVIFGGEADRLYSDHILGEAWIYDPDDNKWERKE